MSRFKDLLQEVEKDLNLLDDIVYPEDEDIQDENIQDEDMEDEDMEEYNLPEKILSEHLYLDSYDRTSAYKYMDAIKDILEYGDAMEWYNLGILLIYLSENRWVANKLLDYLEY